MTIMQTLKQFKPLTCAFNCIVVHIGDRYIVVVEVVAFHDLSFNVVNVSNNMIFAYRCSTVTPTTPTIATHTQ